MCPFAVRVALSLSLADFLGSMITCTQLFPKEVLYFRVSAQVVDLPATIICLLYTCEADDEQLCVSRCGRRNIKKKKQTPQVKTKLKF